MKSHEEFIAQVKDNRIHKEIMKYFVMFVPTSVCEEINYCVQAYDENGEDIRVIKEWTEANVIEQMKEMTRIGFEFGLTHRGTSAAWMRQALYIYTDLLEDKELLQKRAKKNLDALYGLPLYKAIAVRYGFPNPIGDDEGNEEHYFVQRNTMLGFDDTQISKNRGDDDDGDGKNVSTEPGDSV
jgi:hypothetical protein